MEINILVIEDIKNWRIALREMYESFTNITCTTRGAQNIQEAEELLATGKYDIMSLDIDLSQGRVCGSKTFVPNANGLDLLQRAADRNWVKGAIVISGVTLDKEADRVIPKKQLRSLMVDLGSTVNKIFPGTKVFSKNPLLHIPLAELNGDSLVDVINSPHVINKLIEDFQKEGLTSDLVKSVASPSYILDVSGAEFNEPRPEVSIALKTATGRKTPIYQKHALFLYHLARKNQVDGDNLSQEDIIAIFYDTKDAQVAIDSVRKHLRSKGINPQWIFIGTIKHGFSLVDSLEVKGINKRFNSNYELIINHGYSPKVTVTVRFQRKQGLAERVFSNRDAVFLWDLAILANDNESMPAKRVCERLGCYINSADEKGAFEIARQQISKFSARLWQHEIPLDPFKIIRLNNVHSGWLLKESVKVTGLSSVGYLQRALEDTGRDERMPVHDEKLSQPVEDLLDNPLFMDFLKKNKQFFSEWDVCLLMEIFKGTTTADFAEEKGMTESKIKEEILRVKEKWHKYGGPDFSSINSNS